MNNLYEVIIGNSEINYIVTDNISNVKNIIEIEYGYDHAEIVYIKLLTDKVLMDRTD